MKRLMRGEMIAVLCTAIFLVICVGRYSLRNRPSEEMLVMTSRTVQSATVEEHAVQDVLKTLLPGEKINLNTAPVKDLARLPGVGERIADEIVTLREALGGFRSIRELNRVPGISTGLYSEIEPYITVNDIG